MEEVEQGLAESLGRTPGADVSRVVDHFFRHESGKVVATLTRIFGLANLSLAEDVVQDALLKALQTWSYAGIPQNPSAWIMRVARNQALDVIRREQNFRNKEEDVVQATAPSAAQLPLEDGYLESDIQDDQLRLMFACCHPILAQEGQVALTLKTLCGFNTEEIARAFLTSEPAVAKRLVRAKQRIREANLRFEIPSGEEACARLEAVWQALYLLFNEGYKASQGDALVRKDLCDEAIRLTRLLVQSSAGNRAETHALLALMFFSAARLPARLDGQGNLLLLAEQDRSLWDERMIQQGFLHLARSAEGDVISSFHLQAGIAACHCSAKDPEATDWTQILALYDLLFERDPSPVIALNRVVAVAKVLGAAAGLKALLESKLDIALEDYYLFHSVAGQLYFETADFASAARCFQRAFELTSVTSERAFLSKRLKACER